MGISRQKILKIKGLYMDLTHLDEQNKPKMVDVSDKEETKRKGKHEKHLDKLEQKKKRLQIEIDNIKKKRGSKKVKKEDDPN